MKKVKHIFTIFIHSLLPQDIYYPKLLHTSLSFSIKYFLSIILSLAFIFTTIMLYKFSPARLLSYKSSVINSLSSFPPEIRLSIKNGILDSNLDKPLFLWIYNSGQPQFVVMVHTKDMISQSEIPLPFVFLGIDKAQFSYKGNSVVKPYNNSLNITITKEKVQTLIQYINSSFSSFIFFFYLFLILIVPLVYTGGSLFFILISSSLAYILLKTFIPHIHLKKCIQASLHGTHLPLFIAIFLFTLFPSAINVVTIIASLIFVFTLVATYEMYSKDLPHRKGR